MKLTPSQEAYLKIAAQVGEKGFEPHGRGWRTCDSLAKLGLLRHNGAQRHAGERYFITPDGDKAVGVEDIRADDLDCLRWAGVLGHMVFAVRDNRGSVDRTKPGVVSECNTVESAMRDAKHGDRIYQKIGPKKYKLVHTVNIASVTTEMRSASCGML